MKKLIKYLPIIIFSIIAIFMCRFIEFAQLEEADNDIFDNVDYYDDVSDVPDFDGDPFVVINNNIPNFRKSELKAKSFEKYSELDIYDRPGIAKACIGSDIMPTEERKSLKNLFPQDWYKVSDKKLDGKPLFNKCHIIGYQLTGENENIFNTMIGTTYFNNNGMLPFENMVADYIKETDNHVLYRVTPIYDGKNFLAKGVQIEAKSIEDDEISFNVFVYNAHPEVKINYKTGEIKKLQ